MLLALTCFPNEFEYPSQFPTGLLTQTLLNESTTSQPKRPLHQLSLTLPICSHFGWVSTAWPVYFPSDFRRSPKTLSQITLSQIFWANVSRFGAFFGLAEESSLRRAGFQILQFVAFLKTSPKQWRRPSQKASEREKKSKHCSALIFAALFPFKRLRDITLEVAGIDFPPFPIQEITRHNHGSGWDWCAEPENLRTWEPENLRTW